MCCRDDQPIVVVLKAMGLESDQEIQQLVGLDGNFAQLLAPSIQKAREANVYTQQQALEYLGGWPGGSCRTFQFGLLSCTLPAGL